jgi:phosphate starvation-inducible PhoH-like protein
MNHRTILLRDLDEERALFGSLDRHLHLLRRLYGVDAVSRGGAVRISGEPDALEGAARAVELALDHIRRGSGSDGLEVERIFRRGAPAGEDELPDSPATGEVPAIGPRVMVQPRTPNQARYVQAMRDNTVTFGIGPAGTGKSFLAVAMAVSCLRSGTFRRIVLCRPAVEAGESLGYLPGDLAAKINPYLRPLYDALNELLPRGQLKRYIEEDVIEILPLAYMRGRTLDHAFIILDEAQNCTHTQMKMALTRLGAHSRMVVTGDVTQIDLPGNKSSGLVVARRILAGIEGVEFVTLAKADIVRHPVVAEIVRAYGREEEAARRIQETPHEAGPGTTGGAPAAAPGPGRPARRRGV